MDATLPFPIKLAFLLLVLPVALVYLASVAGVAVLVVRTLLNKLISRFQATRPRGP